MDFVAATVSRLIVGQLVQTSIKCFALTVQCSVRKRERERERVEHSRCPRKLYNLRKYSRETYYSESQGKSIENGIKTCANDNSNTQWWFGIGKMQLNQIKYKKKNYRNDASDQIGSTEYLKTIIELKRAQENSGEK